MTKPVVARTFITSPEQIAPESYYALPHEVVLMRAELDGITLKRSGIAGHIDEAMSQSSETWHDNAPAEALFHEMGLIDRREASLRNAQRRLHVVAYPPIVFRLVTIGSRVICSLGGEEFPMDITGNLPIAMEEQNGVEIGSIEAPIPRAILGLAAGQTAMADIHGRELPVHVLDVDQLAQREFYEGAAE